MYTVHCTVYNLINVFALYTFIIQLRNYQLPNPRRS